VVRHRGVAIVAGEASPALSVSFGDGMYGVFFAECRLDVPADEWPEAVPVCLGCLIEDADEQLARGLDLARVHGQVDWDVVAGEWFVPADADADVGSGPRMLSD
jgi:hypothetical protein